MNNNFSIKNFRSYGETGASFNIAPITILTGCNSSGKSSLVKAQLLLSDVLKQIKEKKSLYGIELRVSDKNLQLGRFDKVLNKYSKSDTIVFEYETMSYLLAERFRVKMSFVKSEDNLINNGILSEFLIEKLDGSLIYSAKELNKSDQRVFHNLKYPNIEYNLLDILENYKKFALFSIISGSHEIEENPIKHNPGEDIGRIHAIKLEYGEKYFGEESANRYYADCFSNVPTDIVNNIGIINPSALKFLLDYDIMSYWFIEIISDLKKKEKSDLRRYLISKLEENHTNVDENYRAWINYFADDFENSKYNTFFEYFKELEHEYIKNKSLDSKISHNSFSNYIYAPVILGGNKREGSNYKLDREDYEERLDFRTITNALLHIFNINSDSFSNIILDHDDKQTIYKLSAFDLFKNMEDRRPKDLFYLFEKFNKYVETSIEEIITPSFPESITYVDSSSVNIHRLYSTEEENKIAINLKHFIKADNVIIREEKRNPINKLDKENCIELNGTYSPTWNEINGNSGYVFYEKGTFINSWIKEFGIGDSIEIRGTEEGLGVLVYLKKDGETRLLADEGYGITQLFSLLLQIENSILNITHEKYAKTKWDKNAGFSSQIVLRSNPKTIYIEEPENHLHPKFQSMLADLFLEAYQKYNIHFIIETHSEYLIRKLQLHVADKKVEFSSDDVSLNYIDTDEEGFAFNKPIEVQEDGRLKESFGSGFFDEADKLAVELIMFKAQKK